MNEPIVNRVSKSKLITFDLQEFYPKGERVFFDISEWLEQGLVLKEIKFNKNVILSLIRYYTREAGVRGLERQIAKILRKVVKERLVNNKSNKSSTTINTKNLEKSISGLKIGLISQCFNQEGLSSDVKKNWIMDRFSKKICIRYTKPSFRYYRRKI